MRTFRFVLVALVASLWTGIASAQQPFPVKQIRLIVPFPPGGPNDIIARVVGQKMGEILGQTIVIENKSGQGGVLGTDFVAKSAPDGYTIGVASAGALAISPSMEKVAYNTATDLQPVTLVAKVPEMLVVATTLPIKNLNELVDYAKESRVRSTLPRRDQAACRNSRANCSSSPPRSISCTCPIAARRPP